MRWRALLAGLLIVVPALADPVPAEPVALPQPVPETSPVRPPIVLDLLDEPS